MADWGQRKSPAPPKYLEKGEKWTKKGSDLPFVFVKFILDLCHGYR